ncbi:MAG: ATP-binding cassette domain-containing protein, partial [Mucinivorans sp.]
MAAEDQKVIFSMVGVSKTFVNNKKVLDNIYLSFYYGAKIGIIGLNGSGKSTLMKIIAGIEKNFIGEVVFSPGYSVGYLEQEPKLDPEKTVRQVVEEGCADVVALLAEYEAVNAKFMDEMTDDQMAALIDKQGELTEKIDHVGGWELDNKLSRAMDALGCPPSDALIKVLSGGERRRVALCRLLLQEPDVLLLDEPTNHLDLDAILWLEDWLKSYPGTLLLISHDRDFLDAVVDHVAHVEQCKLTLYRGGYTAFERTRAERLAQQQQAYEKQQA